jgi:hypothetical protein
MRKFVIVCAVTILSIFAVILIELGQRHSSQGIAAQSSESNASASNASSENDASTNGEAGEREPELYTHPHATARAAATTRLPTGPVALSKPPTGSSSSASSLTSFGGVTWPGGSSCQSYGYCIPPDTTLGKSSNRVLEGVNAQFLLTNNAGTLLDSKTIADFFNFTPGSFHEIGFDPKIIYDRNATRPRFYVAALTSDATTQTSNLHLAISRSTDPATLGLNDWCRYNFAGVTGAGTTSAAWADYPEIGVGLDGLIITTNQYRFSDNQFMYSRVRILQKLKANNNAAACPGVSSFNLGTWRLTSSNTDWTRITVIPAMAYTSTSSFTGVSDPIYMVSSPDTDASGLTPGMPTSANYYRIWRVSNIGSGSPSFESATIGGNFTYTTPPRGVQSGGQYYTDTFDTRGMAAVSYGNKLYYAHQTACNVTSGTANESCIRFVRFNVGESSSGTLGVSISQQLTSSPGDGWFLSHPSIAVNQSGQTALTTQATSASTNLSSWWAIKNASDTGWSFNFLGQGTCANDGEYDSGKNAIRVGDYTGTVTEPYYLNTFWVAGEAARQVGTSGCHWTTRIANVSP